RPEALDHLARGDVEAGNDMVETRPAVDDSGATVDEPVEVVAADRVADLDGGDVPGQVFKMGHRHEGSVNDLRTQANIDAGRRPGLVRAVGAGGGGPGQGDRPGGPPGAAQVDRTLDVIRPDDPDALRR